jgi:hypothetical protein
MILYSVSTITYYRLFIQNRILLKYLIPLNHCPFRSIIHWNQYQHHQFVPITQLLLIRQIPPLQIFRNRHRWIKFVHLSNNGILFNLCIKIWKINAHRFLDFLIKTSCSIVLLFGSAFIVIICWLSRFLNNCIVSIIVLY